MVRRRRTRAAHRGTRRRACRARGRARVQRRTDRRGARAQRRSRRRTRSPVRRRPPRARHLLDGERLAYGRRTAAGTTRRRPSRRGPRRPESRRTLLCGDALDPPLIPGMFGRVVALNLLDSVRHPRRLLGVVDGLCAPGGEVILSSPYSWQSNVMHDHERFGGADPAAELVAFSAPASSCALATKSKTRPSSRGRSAATRAARWPTALVRARKI